MNTFAMFFGYLVLWLIPGIVYFKLKTMQVIKQNKIGYYDNLHEEVKFWMLLGLLGPISLSFLLFTKAVDYFIGENNSIIDYTVNKIIDSTKSKK